MYFGAWTQISPRSPMGSSVLPSSVDIIMALQFAFSSPTEEEGSRLLGSQPRIEHVASVMPQPCCAWVCC